jgi:alpha-L-fucosidase
MIFHWGLYSVPAYDPIESARRRKLKNGSEWYLKRLLDSGEYRPISGHLQTKEYHTSHNFPDYFDFEFPGPNFNGFDKWITLSQQFNYYILTAKHHDGYCLWPTATTDKHSDTNLIQMFKDTVESENKEFGVYYSLTEFNKSATKQYIDNIMVPQILELIEYEPLHWWFDGQWDIKTQYACRRVEEMCRLIKTKIPHATINNRICGSDHEKELCANINYLNECATYRVYGDRSFPRTQPEILWQYIDTIGLSWGRNKQQKEIDYKSGADLHKLFTRTEEMGGEFLINMGPDANGKLDPFEVRAMREFNVYFN